MRRAEPRRCNGALNKPSYQVSGTIKHREAYPAFLANDGVRLNDLGAGSCAVFGHVENPWWVVDLRYAMKVEFVLLTICK